MFGDVDGIAAEHGVAECLDSGPARDGGQQLDGLGGQAVLGVVEQDPVDLGDHDVAPVRFRGEQLAQVEVSQRCRDDEAGPATPRIR